MCRRHKKGTQETEALGRSRGGFSTKLHARCDAKGRPLGFVLTPGQSHDIQGFGPLFRLIAHKIEALLADKGYDADAIREELANADVEAVIPAKSNRRDPIPHDREKYRWRNLVERLFNKLKNWRRIATRYDKTKESYLGFVNLVSALNGYPLSTKPSLPSFYGDYRSFGIRLHFRQKFSDAAYPRTIRGTKASSLSVSAAR